MLTIQVLLFALRLGTGAVPFARPGLAPVHAGVPARPSGSWARWVRAARPPPVDRDGARLLVGINPGPVEEVPGLLGQVGDVLDQGVGNDALALRVVRHRPGVDGHAEVPDLERAGHHAGVAIHVGRLRFPEHRLQSGLLDPPHGLGHPPGDADGDAAAGVDVRRSGESRVGTRRRSTPSPCPQRLSSRDLVQRMLTR